VGGHAAGSDSPLGGRVREAEAVFAGGELLSLLAAFTSLHNGMAAPSIKLTPIFVHKKTVKPFLYSCTNHGYHILSIKLHIN